MHRRMISWTLALAVSAIVAAGAALSGCKPPDSDAATAQKGADDEKSPEADPIPVETLTVEARDYTERFDIAAKVEPVDQVTVAAEAGGRVLSAPFEQGEEVRAGSRLLRVDTELDSARIRLLENQLDSAQREYDRTKNLHKKGLATPQQLDQAETALDNARLSLDQAKVGASKGGVRSPMSGTVLQKHIEKGEFAAPGAPVATIIDYDRVIVAGQVPESHIRLVKKGDEVDVELPALDTQVVGQVTHRALTASPKTGTFEIEVTVDNADHEILPGMSARLLVVQKKWKDIVVVPREAVLQGFARSETMLLPGEETTAEAALRVVELGPGVGPDVLITSGISAGDRLIVRGHRGLVDGALARRVRHFDSIEQMRTSGAAIDVSDDQASQKSEAETASGDQGQ